MTESVVTGIFTLLGALGGVWLTLRHSSAEAHRERVEARRADIRAELATATILTRDLLSRYEVLVPAYARMTLRDHAEFVETDTGKELRALVPQVKASLDKLHYLVGDPELVAIISRLRDAVDKIGPLALAPLFEAKGSATMEQVGQSLAMLDAAKDVLVQVQDTAAPLLRVDLATRPSRSLSRSDGKTPKAG